MYYRLILEGGHLGAGKSLDFVRYFKADNPVDVFTTAARMPRVKGKDDAKGVKLIQRVSREEYIKGIRLSEDASYVSTRKRNKRKNKNVTFH